MLLPLSPNLARLPMHHQYSTSTQYPGTPYRWLGRDETCINSIHTWYVSGSLLPVADSHMYTCPSLLAVNTIRSRSFHTIDLSSSTVQCRVRHRQHSINARRLIYRAFVLRLRHNSVLNCLNWCSCTLPFVAIGSNRSPVRA